MRAPPRLIVHADDFGLSEAVNRGIVAAHERGILTSASLMATGSAFEQAVALAKATPTLDLGVHLTLTEERPLVQGPGSESLVGSDGRFHPHLVQFAARHARGKISLSAVEAELDAQVQKVFAAGLAVTHLDGHQHVHVLPGIARVVAALGERYGVAVRYPAERVRSYMLRNWRAARRVAEQVALGAVCAVSPLRRRKRIDEFFGFYFGGRLDETNLATVVLRLRPGRTAELMCHPGAEDPGTRYAHWRYAWTAERDALMSPRIKALLAERNVRLISYRDL
jgi:predicted glycoside hydrolase/deacetylase ChbG (UPF0249 family)